MNNNASSTYILTDKDVKMITDEVIRQLEKKEIFQIDSNKYFAENGINKTSLENDLVASKLNDVDFADYLIDILGTTASQHTLAKKLSEIYNIIQNVNDALIDTATTKNGFINQNKNLHGFLFERWHSATFNAKAKLLGKDFLISKVKIPEGTYTLNSKDIQVGVSDDITNGIDIVSNSKGTRVSYSFQSYQSKACSDAKKTISAIQKGNYNNQRLLVPKEQVQEVKDSCLAARTVTDRIEALGIESTPTTYENIRKLSDAIKTGNFDNVNINIFSTKELVLAGLDAIKDAIIIDALIRSVAIVINTCFNSNHSPISEQLERNGIELASDLGILTTSFAIDIAIEKNAAMLPKWLVAIPNRSSFIYVTIHTLINMISIINEGQKNELGREEITAQLLKEAVIMASRIAGSAIGGTFGGVGGTVGAILGALSGTAINNLIGDENFYKASEWIWKLIDTTNDKLSKIPNVITPSPVHVNNKDELLKIVSRATILH